MPMNTMWDRRPSPRSAAMRAQLTTWSTISAVVRLRVRPPWPVAQKGQAMPQPACEETHAVTRSG